MIKIRLKSMGRAHKKFYRIVVIDGRKPRDGRELEKIGYYDPSKDISVAELDVERFMYWKKLGAQQTKRIEAIIRMLNRNGTTNIRY